MALDATALQYAQLLYAPRFDEIRERYGVRTAQTIRDLEIRGMGNSGQFHTQLARIGIERIGEMTDAKVDSLLTAYKRIGAPIDNDAVNFINHEASAIYDIQGQYLITEARDRAGRSNAPPGVASAVAATIESAMTAIKSRINHRLLALRNEHILDMRLMSHPATPIPQPETAVSEVQPHKKGLTTVEKWGIAGAIATVIGVVIGALTVPEVRRFFHLDKPSISQPTGTSTAPPPQTEPPRKPLQVITADNIFELRQKNQVTQLHKTESGKTLSEIPPGSFGFTMESSLITRDLGDPQDLEISSTGPTDEFEIHKLADSTALLVAFVGSETLDRLREDVKLKEPVSLYSDSWKEASTAVALPLTQVKCSRYRYFSDGDKGKRKLIAVLDCQTQ